MRCWWGSGMARPGSPSPRSLGPWPYNRGCATDRAEDLPPGKCAVMSVPREPLRLPQPAFWGQRWPPSAQGFLAHRGVLADSSVSRHFQRAETKQNPRPWKPDKFVQKAAFTLGLACSGGTLRLSPRLGLTCPPTRGQEGEGQPQGRWPLGHFP